MPMTQADLDKIRARYAHYGTPKPNTAHADVVALLAEMDLPRSGPERAAGGAGPRGACASGPYLGWRKGSVVDIRPPGWRWAMP